MSAIDDARAALAKYYAVSQGGYGAGEHQNLAAALRILSDEYERLTAPPTDNEREALEEWSFEHRPILSMRDGSIASCKCMDRVFITGQEDWDQHMADAILAAFPGVERLTAPPTDDEREALAQIKRETPADEASIQADTESLAAEIHEAWEFQYDQCDHGLYMGGHLHGEPYAMCRLSAERIVRRRLAKAQEGGGSR